MSIIQFILYVLLYTNIINESIINDTGVYISYDTGVDIINDTEIDISYDTGVDISYDTDNSVEVDMRLLTTNFAWALHEPYFDKYKDRFDGKHMVFDNILEQIEYNILADEVLKLSNALATKLMNDEGYIKAIKRMIGIYNINHSYLDDDIKMEAIQAAYDIYECIPKYYVVSNKT